MKRKKRVVTGTIQIMPNPGSVAISRKAAEELLRKGDTHGTISAREVQVHLKPRKKIRFG